MTTKQDLPRGIRNNNPLNIRRNDSNSWVGKVVTRDSDVDFETFRSSEYGIRAAILIVQKYIRRGTNTPNRIIHTWAPPNENATKRYCSIVAMLSGLDMDEAISVNDRSTILNLLHAMTYVECGQYVEYRYFQAAANMLNWT